MIDISLLRNNFLLKIANRFPFVKKLRWWFIAFKDNISPVRASYSQFGEDRIVSDLLHAISPEKCIYIDVGANQPTLLSNTYLFYRMGFRGVAIEPNKELSQLYRKFRPGDIHLEIGCSYRSGVGRFRYAESTVASGFSDDILDVRRGISWVPVLTVDEIWSAAGGKKMVSLLSVDTEGYDLLVLKGAMETIRNTACLIIETSESDKKEINAFLPEYGFKLIKSTNCNLIWYNEETARKIMKL